MMFYGELRKIVLLLARNMHLIYISFPLHTVKNFQGENLTIMLTSPLIKTSSNLGSVGVNIIFHIFAQNRSLRWL